jgi:hypothetical protein
VFGAACMKKRSGRDNPLLAAVWLLLVPVFAEKAMRLDGPFEAILKMLILAVHPWDFKDEAPG